MKCYDPVNATYNGKPIPKGYPYLCILLEGPPKKDSPDHPRMALSKRAKIFAPYSALSGFGDITKKREAETRSVPDFYENDEFEI